MDTNLAPLISVVIPTFNHAKYLKRALESVCNQTYLNWEAIVIDNYSSDNTDEIIKNFSDKRIKSFKFNNNGIISASRNLGISEAQGEWIAFLDSDDWWFPQKLRVCLNIMSDNVDFIYHNLNVIYERPSIFKKRMSCKKVQSPVLRNLLLMGNPIANSGVVVRKSLLIKVGGISQEPEMVAAEDYNTWLKIASITNSFFYISKSLGGCLVHEQGMSQRDMSVPHKFAIEDFKHHLSLKESQQLEKDLYYISGRYKYLKGNFAKARTDLLQSLSFKKLFQSVKAFYMILISIILRLLRN